MCIRDSLKTDTSYRLSLFLKSRNYSAPLRVFLVDELGQRVSNVIEVNIENRDWTKYTGELKPVSYTHLEEYKRQGFLHLDGPYNLCDGTSRE